MKKSRLLGALCACLATISFSANAAIITQGYLTTNDDGTSNIISDSLNGVEYLRLDVLADLTYAQTLAVLGTQDGGGWSIATPGDAIGFANALLGGAALCEHDGASPTITDCGPASGWYDGKLGDDFNSAGDQAWFLDENGLADVLNINNADLVQIKNATTIVGSDEYSSSGSVSSQPVTWLVVRPTSVVPIPAALWLFGSGLLGLIGIARRKKGA